MTDKNANTEIHKEFCPNCEAETPCTHEAELYVCDICGEDFAKYIVSRNCNVSDVSMTRDVSTDIKTPSSIENTNPDYYKQEIARRDEQTTKHLAWMAEQGNTITGLRNELKDRDERIAELEAMINPASFDKYLVSRIKDPGVAEDYARVRIEDKTNYEIIEKQADIIKRLKEDAETLASISVGGMTKDAEEYWECPCCMAMAYNAGYIHHTPDCPITLHRALMKELE